MRDGWRETTLGQVATATTSQVPAATSGLPYYGLEHFDSGSPRISRSGDSAAMDGAGVTVSPGDVLFSKLRPYLNKVAVAGESAVASTEVLVYRPFTTELDASYLALLLRDARTVDYAVARSAGSRMPRTSAKVMAELPISLPPLDEQRRIVHLIAAVDDAVDAAEAEASNILRAWAVLCDAIAAAGDAAERNVAQMVTLAKSGGTPSRANPAYYGGAIPWLKSGEVRGRAISKTSETITEEALVNSSAWLAPAESVLVAMYGGGTVGQVGQLAAPMATNQAVLALVADEAVISSRMLYHLLASDTERLAAKAVGAAQANISKKVVLDHVLRVPPIERQRELADVLDAQLDSADAARVTAESLRTLRSNLLTVLLSGEHEIPSSYDVLLEEVA